MKGVAYIDDQAGHERAMFSGEADVRVCRWRAIWTQWAVSSLSRPRRCLTQRCLWTEQAPFRHSGDSVGCPDEASIRGHVTATTGGTTVSALERSLGAEGFRVLAPVGQSPTAIRTQLMRGRWSETGQTSRRTLPYRCLYECL